MMWLIKLTISDLDTCLYRAVASVREYVQGVDFDFILNFYSLSLLKKNGSRERAEEQKMS